MKTIFSLSKRYNIIENGEEYIKFKIFLSCILKYCYIRIEEHVQVLNIYFNINNTKRYIII